MTIFKAKPFAFINQMDIYTYEVNSPDASREIFKSHNLISTAHVLLANFTKKKQLKASEKLIFPPMLMICLYVPGILSIEGVQSLGFALNLEASPPVGGDSIVSVDGHRFVKSVRWYRRLLRGTVDTKQHFINSAVHRFEKQNNLFSLC